MIKRSSPAVLMAVLVAAALQAPANAATDTVNVTVNASTQATIGVTYSNTTGPITCDVGTSLSGMVACTNTATLSGGFRSTKNNTGGASVTVTGADITGSGGWTVHPSALQMTCTGGTTGSPTYGGTAGTLASGTALSTSAVACQSWTGTIIANYSLDVSLAIDASQVAADTYSTTGFTATATAN
jgi:hypothetical protein